MIKISVLGDIMCEPLLLKAAEKKDGSYDFTGVFSNIKSMLSESDYVIGNLETPLAGKEAKYVHDLFSFNAPDEFADAVRGAGIHFVSTANNHCLDRGFDGLKRTIQVLDKKNIAHDGTFLSNDETRHPFIASVRGIKVAIIPFTYATNYGVSHHSDASNGYVNLLHSDTIPVYKKGRTSASDKVKNAFLKPLGREQKIRLKKWLGLRYNSPRQDNYLDEEEIKDNFSILCRRMEEARQKADIVLFCPHVGGQFNIEPGRFTEYTIEKGLDYGADAIIASHPHIVQKAEKVQGVPVFYSIGNFSMSPNSVYLLHEHLPDYGLTAHLYIDDHKKITRTTFSILKITENKKEPLAVYPAEKYYRIIRNTKEEKGFLDDIRQIYKAVTGKEAEKESIIQKEYLLY